MLRVSLQDEITGEVHSFSVEGTELTTMLVEHMLMQDITLEALYGVRNIHAYRRAMFTAIRDVAEACN
jgi:hypothetical protein